MNVFFRALDRSKSFDNAYADLDGMFAFGYEKMISHLTDSRAFFRSFESGAPFVQMSSLPDEFTNPAVTATSGFPRPLPGTLLGAVNQGATWYFIWKA